MAMADAHPYRGGTSEGSSPHGGVQAGTAASIVIARTWKTATCSTCSSWLARWPGDAQVLHNAISADDSRSAYLAASGIGSAIADLGELIPQYVLFWEDAAPQERMETL
jgi:hypothetical protein